MVGGIVQAFLSSGTISAGSKSNSGKTWGSAKIGPLRPPIPSSRGRGDITNNNGSGSESFISAKESESSHREQQKEEPSYNERYLKREGESPSMISQARLAASASARRTLTNDAAAVSGASSTWEWSGRLVARILPKAFSEYESSKPKWAIDPSSLEGGVIEPINKAPVMERKGSEGVCSDVLSLAPADQDGCQYDLSGSRGESDLLVTLDVFLFSQHIPSFVNIQRSIHGPGSGSGSGSNSDINSESGSVGASSTSPDTEEGSQLLFIHMKRDADESALRTLRRLELSTEKKMQAVSHKSGRGKRQNKKRTENIATQNVTASSSMVVKANPKDEWNNGDMLQEMDLSGLTNAELWRKVAYEYELHPDQRNRVGVSVLNPDVEEDSPDSYIHLDVVCCPPTILRVQVFENFEAQVFVGVPLVIETELIYASRAVINWYVGGELVSKDNRSYTPKPEDIGKSLSVLIVPTRPGHDGRGCEEAYRFKNLVEALPWMPIVSPIRDGWTQKRSASERDDLRVLTYNILADLYTSRDVDQHLMYAHCDLSHLMRWRRMPMLIYEILAYNADVICLQEVDTSIYDTLLRPVLESKGYQGFYSNKASTQQEGCAMFWSTSCFEEVTEFDMKTISIRDLFAEHEDHLLKGNVDSTDDSGEGAGNKQLSKWSSMDEILDLMGKHDELRRIAREKTGQILQVATLTLKSPRDDATNAKVASKPKRMILANTHLFYHPLADHVRAMQAYVVCKKIDEVRRQDGSDPYPLVFCGDLNSDPLSAAVQLLAGTRAVDSHHEAWKHLHDYRWEMGDTSWMLDHGYVGNEATADTEEDPLYVEETFEEAHEDEESLADDSFTEPFHPPPIVLPPSFPNLVSGCPDMPEFTNFAVDFVETLDYVLASETSEHERYGFRPKKAAPMPNADEISRYVAMPNEFMPSDHVSVVCDLEWTTNETSPGAERN